MLITFPKQIPCPLSVTQYPRYTKIEHKAAVLDLLLSSRHPSPSTHCVFVALIKKKKCYPSAISTLSISSYSFKVWNCEGHCSPPWLKVHSGTFNINYLGWGWIIYYMGELLRAKCRSLLKFSALSKTSELTAPRSIFRMRKFLLNVCLYSCWLLILL